MPTRDQVLRLVESGLSYEDVGRRLSIQPGLAYLIATGIPADGGDTVTGSDRSRAGALPVSSQHLASPPPAENPTTKPHVLEWIKSRAHGDAQMLRAAAARDAAPGEVEDPDERDAVTVLTRDHDRVTAMLQQLSAIPGHKKGGSDAQIQRRQSIVDLITVALSQHESVEEEFFWPAVRKHLPDGDELADTALRQEQEGKDTLTALGKTDPDSDAYDDLVEELVARARAHVAFEDRVLLTVTTTLEESEREKLGRKLAAAKKAKKG